METNQILDIKTSVCLTTYNRTDLVIEAIEQIVSDPRVDEIVIVDDCSDINQYYLLELKLMQFKNQSHTNKIRLERNPKNLDCYLNKKRAIELAKNDWCIIFDSDNILTKQYLDVLFEYEWAVGWNKKILLTPEFARPAFDFRWLSNTLLSRSNVARFIDQRNCEVMLNAMNYFVNREEYLRVFDNDIDPITSDSIYQALRWLENDNKIYVLPGLQYDHRLHIESHYLKNVKRTPQGFHEEIVARLRQLR